METIKVSYTNKGTIPSAIQYANTNPSYTMTREFQIPEDQDPVQYAEMAFQDMKVKVDGYLEADFNRISELNKVNGAEALGHKFSLIDGVEVPHVTSIISPEPPSIPFLEDHGELGTWFDGVFKAWAQTGKIIVRVFKDAGNIKQTSTEILKEFEAWVKVYGSDFKITATDVFVHNKDFNYCGSLDCEGTYKGEFAIIDAKKTKQVKGEIKEKYLKQVAAYAKERGAKVLVIVSPYGEPIVSVDVDLYFGKFLMDRGAYKERFGK